MVNSKVETLYFTFFQPRRVAKTQYVDANFKVECFSRADFLDQNLTSFHLCVVEKITGHHLDQLGFGAFL